jgi:hypothetical protein
MHQLFHIAILFTWEVVMCEFRSPCIKITEVFGLTKKISKNFIKTGKSLLYMSIYVRRVSTYEFLKFSNFNFFWKTRYFLLKPQFLSSIPVGLLYDFD